MIPLEEVSDDDEDEFTEEEVSDSDDDDDKEDDLDSFIEVEVDETNDLHKAAAMPVRSPAGMKLRAKKSPLRDKTAAAVNTLTSSVSKLKLAGGGYEKFSMDFKYPFIVTTYKDQEDDFVNLQLMTPTFPKEYFLLDVIDDGMVFQLRTEVPNLFMDEARVLAANQHTEGFNTNTHLAQSWATTCNDISNHFNMVTTVYGEKPQTIQLPFACEERIVYWELEAHKNKEGDLTDELAAQQYFFLLSVSLRKLRTKRKTTGTIRLIEDDDMEEDAGHNGDNDGT